MANVTIPPIPYKTPVVDEKGIVTPPWSKWFLFIFTQLNTVKAEVDVLTQGPVL